MVVWLFLAVPWVCLRFVIVVFPDHTNKLFSMSLPRVAMGWSMVCGCSIVKNNVGLKTSATGNIRAGI